MSQILSLLGPVARILRRLHGQPAQTAPEPVPEDTVPLDKILMLFAHRPALDETWRPEGSRTDTFRIMTCEMSPDVVLFSTEEPLKTGEELELRFLINRGMSLAVRGKIDWVMETAQGFSGQLNLSPPALERRLLRAFLEERRSLKTRKMPTIKA